MKDRGPAVYLGDPGTAPLRSLIIVDARRRWRLFFIVVIAVLARGWNVRKLQKLQHGIPASSRETVLTMEVALDFIKSGHQREQTTRLLKLCGEGSRFAKRRQIGQLHP